jgi:hypothetical protein
MKQTTTIYALIDPRDGRVRYVGKTGETLEKRLAKHLYAAKSATGGCYRISWLKSVLNRGDAPGIVTLFECESNWQRWERFWIKWFREIEPKLTNATDGGDGPSDSNSRITLPCDTCGKMVEKYRNYVSKQSNVYCSASCCSKGNHKNGLIPRRKRAARVTRSCQGCGDSFTVKESSLRNRPCLYCSKPCAYKHGRLGRATGKRK